MTGYSARSPMDRVLWTGAVALAVGGVAAPADAAVIVTNVGSAPPVTLSFNGAAQFSLSTSDVISGTGSNLISTAPDGFGSTVAAKLPAGTSIGPSLFTTSNSASSVSLGFPDSPKTPSLYYIGLDVKTQDPVLGNLDNYGWAEIDSTTPTDVLVAYAFETTPGLAITTPTTSVPEPASLALLALGAAGVASMRRRAA